MKKTILPVLFTCLIYSCGQKTQEAVTVDEPTVNAGVGPSSIEGASYTDPLGVQVTIEAKIIELNKNSSFNAGIGWSRQGANYKDPDYSGTVKTSYINIPILYTYKGNSGLYGEIGLQPSFLLTAKDKGKLTTGFEYNEDYKSSMNKFDLGIAGGTGYMFKNGFGIGARVIYGITKVEKGNDGATHNLLAVGSLKYRFSKGKKKQ